MEIKVLPKKLGHSHQWFNHFLSIHELVMSETFHCCGMGCRERKLSLPFAISIWLNAESSGSLPSIMGRPGSPTEEAFLTENVSIILVKSGLIPNFQRLTYNFGNTQDSGFLCNIKTFGGGSHSAVHRAYSWVLHSVVRWAVFINPYTLLHVKLGLFVYKIYLKLCTISFSSSSDTSSFSHPLYYPSMTYCIFSQYISKKEREKNRASTVTGETKLMK